MDEKRRALNSQFDDFAPGALPSLDSVPGFVGRPQPPLPATEEHFVCLRGPCEHYWQYETEMDLGNPAGTFGPGGLSDAEGNPLPLPLQINRICLRHPGTHLELTDGTVQGCNQWNPITPRMVKERTKRRVEWLKQKVTNG